ncbi:1,2-dihydroxy-3-keto-5-methylthiopentene dioxygenase [Micromonospora sp. DT31]|uniref:1,2-dihydroxy-3-keto-5-methylthiopentene dioxygenase n=1 Tax=Micromonospora sp. DT31 TaxID=3393434 RepID=UPI003CF4F5B1
MSLLQIMPDHDPDRVLLRTQERTEITAALAPLGVTFDRWTLRSNDGGADTDVLAAYRDEVDLLRVNGGFRLVDVVRMAPDDEDPQWPATARAAREKFLDEHTHTEDEVRFFAQGAGCFYLHAGGKVYAMVCEAGDLLSVPANTRHWFDMGERPNFTAIRFFQEEDGWVGAFVADSIARRFPGLDQLRGATVA